MLDSRHEAWRYYSKWNKSERKREILYDIWDFKLKNLLPPRKKKWAHEYRKQMDGCLEQGLGG